jgi:hypothetical protein
MRRVLIGATLLVVAGMTSACGGSPEDASTEDFCAAIQDIPSGDKPTQDEVDDYIDKLEDTGTPEGISENARSGFETWTEVIGDIDVDDSEEEIQKQIEEAVDQDKEKEVDELFEYVSRECAPAPE